MSKWRKLEQYKKIYNFIGPRGSLYLVFGVIAGILVVVSELAFAYILQLFLVVMKIMPMASMHLPEWVPSSNMYLFLAFITVTLLARGFVQWLNNFLISASYEIQREHQRYRLVEWALRASSVSSSELITLYNQGIDEVGTVLTNLQSMSINLATSSLLWAFMLKISFKTTLIATVVLGGVGLLSQRFNVYSGREGKKLATRMEDINIRLLSNIKNLLLVQIYGTQDKEKKILNKKLSEITRDVLSYQKFIHLKVIAPQIIGFVFICGISVTATHRDWIAPAVMVTYFYLFMRFVQSFSELVRLSSSISYSLPTAARFGQWWARHSHDGVLNANAKVTKEAQVVALHKPVGWKLENISFSYPNSHHPIFDHFSLHIPQGSSLVIIGESGSGKSTLLSLLLGVSVPQQGDMSLEIEQKAFPLGQVRQSLLPHVGYVGSESFLVAGSIWDNLVYGLDRTPTEAQVQDALKKSECDFVTKLSDGLNHMITEQGQGLSAGQKQRLSFARALLRNPKVLILDEATANLDSETEKNLIRTLIKLKKSTTLVTVTHREALLVLADQIVKLPQSHLPVGL